jgi:hypothetical protein
MEFRGFWWKRNKREGRLRWKERKGRELLAKLPY